MRKVWRYVPRHMSVGFLVFPFLLLSLAFSFSSSWFGGWTLFVSFFFFLAGEGEGVAESGDETRGKRRGLDVDKSKERQWG